MKKITIIFASLSVLLLVLIGFVCKQVVVQNKVIVSSDRLTQIGSAISIYTRNEGRNPKNMQELVPSYYDGEFVDDWGNQISFDQDEYFIRLTCLGNDGIVNSNDDILLILYLPSKR